MEQMDVSTDLALALDPAAFARSLAPFALPPWPDLEGWQDRFLNWTGRRMLLNCSRQSGKSSITSILALHTALYKPNSLILLISPALRQSGELFRKILFWINQLDVRPEMPEENRLSCEFTNGSRIVSLPSSAATIRGFSAASLLIFDEASQVPDELFLSIYPMITSSKGRIIAMSTPFGRRGWWWQEWENGGSAWERIKVPATEIAHFTPDALADAERTEGRFWYRQEFMCEFLDAQTAAFSYDDVYGALSSDVMPLFAVKNGQAELDPLISPRVKPLLGIGG